MKKLTKEFAYKKNPVLLICDFYGSKEIPSEMTNILANITLFPVANTPLLFHILENLRVQNFKNIILSGKHLNEIICFIETTNFLKNMDFAYYDENVENIGEIFRGIAQFDFKNDILVIQANQYSNVNLKRLEYHHKSEKNLVTFFLHKRVSNDPEKYIYDIQNTQILGITKIYSGEQQENSLSKPAFFFTKPHMFDLFIDNFDCKSMTDLLTTLGDTFLPSMHIFGLQEEDLFAEFESPQRLGFSKESFISISCINNNGYSHTEIYENQMKESYSDQYYTREITTLMDYVEINADFNRIDLRNSSDFFIVEFSNKWDVVFEDDIDSSRIVFFDGHEISNFEIVVVPDSCTVSIESIEQQSFFDDLINYLKRLFYAKNLNYSDPKVIESIQQNIIHFKIFWNAKKEECIEAFALFFAEIFSDCDPERIEELASDSSLLFLFLHDELGDSKKLQTIFMEYLVDSSECISQKYRAQVLYSLIYLLHADKIIHKSILKEFTNLIRSEEEAQNHP